MKIQKQASSWTPGRSIRQIDWRQVSPISFFLFFFLLAQRPCPSSDKQVGDRAKPWPLSALLTQTGS